MSSHRVQFGSAAVQLRVSAMALRFAMGLRSRSVDTAIGQVDPGRAMNSGTVIAFPRANEEPPTVRLGDPRPARRADIMRPRGAVSRDPGCAGPGGIGSGTRRCAQRRNPSADLQAGVPAPG
jgi:hypothetical protein